MHAKRAKVRRFENSTGVSTTADVLQDSKTSFKVTLLSIIVREGDNDPLVESHRHMENPAIYLFFNASVSRKGVKTSAAEIVLHSVIFNSDLNTDLLRDIAFLLQPPPGVCCFNISGGYV